jgi:hypothetical protein
VAPPRAAPSSHYRKEVDGKFNSSFDCYEEVKLQSVAPGSHQALPKKRVAPSLPLVMRGGRGSQHEKLPRPTPRGPRRRPLNSLAVSCPLSTTADDLAVRRRLRLRLRRRVHRRLHVYTQKTEARAKNRLLSAFAAAVLSTKNPSIKSSSSTKSSCFISATSSSLRASAVASLSTPSKRWPEQPPRRRKKRRRRWKR